MYTKNKAIQDKQLTYSIKWYPYKDFLKVGKYLKKKLSIILNLSINVSSVSNCGYLLKYGFFYATLEVWYLFFFFWISGMVHIMISIVYVWT